MLRRPSDYPQQGHLQQDDSQGSVESDHRWDAPDVSQGYTSFDTQTQPSNFLASFSSPSSLDSLEEGDNPRSQDSNMSGYRTPDITSIVAFPTAEHMSNISVQPPP